MRLKRLTLKNWRNFKDVTFEVPERLFIFGPNASGKSNLLDSLRFLKQVASHGGGFQAAVKARGGVKKLRCLAARYSNRGEVMIRINLEDRAKTSWTYEIGFTSETAARRRPILARETIRKNGKIFINRPNREDKKDRERMTQTLLEQVSSNREFRPIVEFLRSIRYLHPVPYLMRGAWAVREDEEGESKLGDASSYGADLIARIAGVPHNVRQRRLKRISSALRFAVPQFKFLKLVRLENVWHLQAGYEHWRPQPALQNESDFSDGTLRLISLLWSLMELRETRRKGLLLLEEPELSLHASIIRQLPGIFSSVCRPGGAQVLVTTHSDEILKDEGLGTDEVLVLEPRKEGTKITTAAYIEDVAAKIEAGLSLLEIVTPHTRPSMVRGFAQEATET